MSDSQRLLTTTQAANALGIAPRTLAGYAKDRIVTPTLTLPSGHYRWDLDDLRRQIREIAAERDEGDA